jgi:hypothetical protein
MHDLGQCHVRRSDGKTCVPGHWASVHRSYGSWTSLKQGRRQQRARVHLLGHVIFRAAGLGIPVDGPGFLVFGDRLLDVIDPGFLHGKFGRAVSDDMPKLTAIEEAPGLEQPGAFLLDQGGGFTSQGVNLHRGWSS